MLCATQMKNRAVDGICHQQVQANINLFIAALNLDID